MYWRPAQDHPFRCDDDEDECGWYRHAALIDGTHIALHDPAFVLADIAAKKAIVEAYVAARTRRDIYQRDDLRADEDEEQAQRRRASAARCRGLEIAVESLAQTYKGRPGWSDEWSG